MNASSEAEEEQHAVNGTQTAARGALLVYQAGVPLMMAVCVAAVALNARCLAAVRWVRRPLSPTLQLSLSLAAADLYTALHHLLHIVLNSYLPAVWRARYGAAARCSLVAMEALRLGGIVTIVLHLTALAANHHLGIVRPLRYPGIATTRHVRLVLAGVWLVPPTAFLAHFSIGVPPGEGLDLSTHCPTTFMGLFAFRLGFSMLLVVPLGFMCCAYAHILLAVRAQTATWARAGGSCRHRGGHPPERHRPKLLVNVRAVHTTLHILGSFVFMYLPAVVSFLLVCPEGCRYARMDARGLWLNWLAQLLLIGKPLTNPVIYAARMQEIQEASRRMRAALRRRWCGAQAPGSQAPPGTTATALCRIASNGSGARPPTTVLMNNETTVL